MIAALVLVSYAVVAGFAGPAFLRRNWLTRNPRIALALWLTLSVSWVIAVTLAALILAVPSLLSWPAAGTPGPPAISHGSATALAGILLAGVLILRVVICLIRDLSRARREQHEHAAFLTTVGHCDQNLGAVVLDHDSPVAYSLSCGRHRIVVSSGTVALLTAGQLQAVLAHERAHLRGHHQLLLTVIRAVAYAFPPVPLLARATGEVAVLAELAADASAAHRHDREDLAAALVVLARARVRAPSLAAGGLAALARIDRLLAPQPRSTLPGRTAGLAALAIALAVSCLPLVAAACDIVGR